MSNKMLEDYIAKRMNQATVILCLKILIENIIKQNNVAARLTKTEVEKEFNSVHNDYGISTFRRDYLLRQAGNDKNAISQSGDLFFIKPDFLSDCTMLELTAIINEINNNWIGIREQQKSLLLKVEAHLDADIDSRVEFIKYMLLDYDEESDSRGKRGQGFEISSFAILQTFAKIRGFALNRFSTVYANFCGVDFAAIFSVYQVTAKMTNKKFSEDIDKAPMKNRVLVFKDKDRDFNQDLLKHELVTDYIDKNDILNDLDYLIRKNDSSNTKQIIEIILEELRREFYCEGLSDV